MSEIPPISGQQDSPLKLEYEQVNDNFRMLADIRFKLLAILPALAGAAVYVLSHIAISFPVPVASQEDLEKAPFEFGTVVLISVLGFVTTFGIALYDQRNTELYNALVGRAKVLEKRMGIADGQFVTRPPRTRRIAGIAAGHDTGLALIYGPVLGSWFFPLVYASLRWAGKERWYLFTPLQVASVAALLMSLLFLENFLRLDGAWKRMFDKWKRMV